MVIETLKNRELPRQGSVESIFERLDSYIAQFDSNWKSDIKPASQESIDKLIQYSGIENNGFEMPMEYRIFLENMGEDDSGILSDYLIGTTSISQLISFYEDTLKYEPEELNPSYLNFANFHYSEELSFAFDLKKETEIAETSGFDFYALYAESFEKLLFQAAFEKFEKIKHQFHIWFGGGEVSLEIVDAIARKEQYAKVWFSDFCNDIWYRDDSVFWLENKGDAAILLLGDECCCIEAFGKKLESAIGVKYQKRNY